jgi:hypothetical protein
MGCAEIPENCINTQKHVCIHLLGLGILDKYPSMVCYSACVCINNYDSIASDADTRRSSMAVDFCGIHLGNDGRLL